MRTFLALVMGVSIGVGAAVALAARYAATEAPATGDVTAGGFVPPEVPDIGQEGGAP